MEFFYLDWKLQKLVGERVNCFYWRARTAFPMLCILGKVVLTSYLLQQGGTAEWKNKCSYFSCLFKHNPVILLPANLLSCSPPRPLLHERKDLLAFTCRCSFTLVRVVWCTWGTVNFCEIKSSVCLSTLCLIGKSSQPWFQGRNSHLKYVSS